MDALKASEIENTETEIQDSGEDYLQVSVAKSDELHERAGDENLGLDDNDTKRSLLQ